ncbi:MAG: fibro-slime domain-containing protein [Deltaproteobacteria bacterium]|nr:fibro-slime domain-containing protein [Deltaproteobacteria bacterium]
MRTWWIVPITVIGAGACGGEDDLGRDTAGEVSSLGGISAGLSAAATGIGEAGTDGSTVGVDDATAGSDAEGGHEPVFDVGGATGTTGMPMECAGDQMLTAKVRDFQQSHPDFEYVIAVDPGIVQADLGADLKPVYAGMPTTPTTNGQGPFDQWYRDTPGVNMPIDVPLVLTQQPDGTYTFDDQAFFPIDGQGFGDEGTPHNFHLTLELHTEFVYQGGEIFSFTGDDDLFTFVNGKLAIDLGGVHGAMNGVIDLDAQAAALGITPGNVYALDFFFAERHTSESHFRIDTTIGCLTDVPVG